MNAMIIVRIIYTHTHGVHVTSSSELSPNTEGFVNFDDGCCCFLGLSINPYLEQNKSDQYCDNGTSTKWDI